MGEVAFQQCMTPDCGATYGLGEVLYACRRCGALLDIRYDWSRCTAPKSFSIFESRWHTPGRSTEARADLSGVWRFRELLPFASLEEFVTIGEGRTLLQQADELAAKLVVKPGCVYLR